MIGCTTTAFPAFAQGMPSFMLNRWKCRAGVDRIQPKGKMGFLYLSESALLHRFLAVWQMGLRDTEKLL